MARCPACLKDYPEIRLWTTRATLAETRTDFATFKQRAANGGVAHEYDEVTLGDDRVLSVCPTNPNGTKDVLV